MNFRARTIGPMLLHTLDLLRSQELVMSTIFTPILFSIRLWDFRFNFLYRLRPMGTNYMDKFHAVCPHRRSGHYE